MRIPLGELSESVSSFLTGRRLIQEETDIITPIIVEAEMRGKKTHGIAKLFLIDSAIQARQGKPEIIKDKGNYVLIDAHMELGWLSAQFATNLLLKKVREYDNAIVATINSSMFTMAGIYAQQIAEAGYISIILCKGGSQTVVPYGGTIPLFGTNPIAIGIPTHTKSIVLDMATSEHTWGEVTMAKIEGKLLTGHGYLDTEGIETDNPVKVDSIVAFGGAKGSGLNYMLEMLTGAFVGSNVGLLAHDASDNGFLFQAFSPEMFTTRETFYKKVEQLRHEVKNSKPGNSFQEVFLPGEQSDKRYEVAQQRGYVEISAELWRKFRALSCEHWL